MDPREDNADKKSGGVQRAMPGVTPGIKKDDSKSLGTRAAAQKHQAGCREDSVETKVTL